MRTRYLLAFSALMALGGFLLAPWASPSVQASVVTGVDTYALTLAASPVDGVPYDAH